MAFLYAVIIGMSALAVASAGALAARPHPKRGRTMCSAVTAPLVMVLAAQGLVFCSLAFQTLWELPLALGMVLGAYFLLGRRLYITPSGVAFYWCGLRRTVIRYSEIEEIAVHRYSDDKMSRQIISRVLLVIKGKGSTNVIGYDNLQWLGESCHDRGVAVALADIYEAVRFRWSMLTVVTLLIIGLLVLHGLWAAGVLDVPVRWLDEPPF